MRSLRSFVVRGNLFSATAASRCSASVAFNYVPMGPPDPILGLSIAFKEDTHADKVNLGAGVYRDDNNKPYVLECVKKASPVYTDMDYTTIAGIPSFVKKAQELAFGPDSPCLKEKRVASTQSLSGTGALRIAADFMHRFNSNKHILVPKPTWGNHNPIFRDAGLEMQPYTYYDSAKKSLNMEGLLGDLKKAPDGSLVLLHACAHNPTGLDPTHEEWQEIVKVLESKAHLPVVDMAYQGFASGDLDTDAYALRLIAEKTPAMVLCQSFAKNFGLYGHRTGACHMVCADADQAEKVLSQIKILVRPMYSNPPIHGARIVDTILSSPELTELWKKELKGMADRMNGIRVRFVEELAKAGSTQDWSHITKQIGMMAYTGLSKDQVLTLRSKWHIYMTDDGRAAISGLNSTNVAYVAKAFHDVTK